MILKSSRAVADIADGLILASVDISVPRERVFHALTTGAEVVKWWGSAETYRTTSYVADIRVGGQWRAEGRDADGKPYSVGGEFLEVDPPCKLVQTWKYDWGEGLETKLTYHLDVIEGGTRLTVRHEGFRSQLEACQGHSEGWAMVLGWLADYFKSEP
jgi:uncharacterized protein YndB with AHSA1/START domain